MGSTVRTVPRRKISSPVVIKLTVSRDVRRRAERGARRLGIDVATYVKLALGERLQRDGIGDE